MITFPTALDAINQRIEKIDPVQYARSRNFSDGAVTYLSPYLSRGVISTKQVFEHLLALDLPWHSIEKLVQELAWRDYWQNIWIAKRDGYPPFIILDQESAALAVQHPRLHRGALSATGLSLAPEGERKGTEAEKCG